MIEDKIEEILIKNNDWNADEEEVEISGVEFSRETMNKVIKDISTLIQKERKDAVEGFAEWLAFNPEVNYNKSIVLLKREYLESEGK